MSNVAISDMGVMLFNFDSTTGKYEYLLPIKAAPATGGAPSQIDATELDSLYKQNILDRAETPAYEFDYNYTIANHKAAEETFDGKTNRKLLMMFQDKSGYAFSGMGAAWTESISAGSAITGKISVAISKKAWVDAIVDTPTYAASTDTEVDPDKVYFTRNGTEPDYTYAVVESPTGVPSTSNYYEIVGYCIDSTSIPTGKFNPFAS